MKIAAFIFNLSKGGAQGVFVNVVNYLYQSGVEIKVVVQDFHDAVYRKELLEDIEVISLGVNSAKKMLPALKKYIIENEFDVGLAFTPEIAINLYIAKIQTKSNFKIVARCINTLSYEYKYADSLFRKYITHSLVKMVYHKVDYVIAQSEGMADDLIQNYRFKKNQICIINNSITPAFEQEMCNREKSIDKDNMILYVGRLEKQKGLSMLLGAFARLKHRDIKLCLLGNGSMKSELQRMAENLGVSKRVCFAEYTRNTIEYYKKAKVTVLSSFFEGFPNVLVESIACGTPVVAYDLPSGPKEIILEFKNGFLAKYLDCMDLAQKIDMALDIEWDSRVVKETAERYAREVIMDKYLNYLEEVGNNV